ncbi:MAG: hypothetical protein JO271_19480 [Verrucomicrobia bacterium]|nr:hypothetical protein [Verrucomicrobiota bacterium]MBV9274044.1 hypothetical protein [Verrucomicrobiota bacterium]
MPIYAPVFKALSEAGISFLVIGGHAVVLHGHQRNTFDLDLLLAEAFLPNAKSALEPLGYTSYFESGAFLQLTPRRGLPPLDIMIVDATTFQRLNQFTESRTFDGEQIRIPDAKRLVALKLHALKASTRTTRDKDWSDIVGIILAAQLDIEDPEFQDIVQTYGEPGAIAKIKRWL